MRDYTDNFKWKVSGGLHDFMRREIDRIKDAAKTDPGGVVPESLAGYMTLNAAGVWQRLTHGGFTLPGCRVEREDPPPRETGGGYGGYGGRGGRADSPSYILRFDGLDEKDTVSVKSDTNYNGAPRLMAQVSIGDLSIAVYYENREIPAFLGLLGAFPGIVRRFPDERARLEEIAARARAQAEKRRKITELRQNTVDTWLRRLCADLRRPYAVIKMATRVDLCVRMENDTQLRVVIPLTRFQDILPTLPDTIKAYEDMIAAQKATVFIERETNQHWYSNQ